MSNCKAHHIIYVKMMQLTNKFDEWSPNYYKTARMFPLNIWTPQLNDKAFSSQCQKETKYSFCWQLYDIYVINADLVLADSCRTLRKDVTEFCLL